MKYVVSFVVFALSLCFDSVSTAQLLKPPFDVQEQRANIGQPGKIFSCLAAPAPPTKIGGLDIYSDRGESQLNPDAVKKSNEAEKPLRKYTAYLSNLSSAYVRSRPKDEKIASCLWTWMMAWAANCSMCKESAMENVYGNNFRNWSLAPIATAYLVLQSDGPYVEKKSDPHLTVRHWVSSLSKTVAADVENRALRNNLAYWAAAGMALAAIGDQDRRSYDSAIQIGAEGIDSVTPNGTLPLEMVRKGRALEYHVFALEPLMLIAQAASANGDDLFHRNNNALQRVSERIFASRYDHSFFDKAAGAKQTAATPLPKGSFVWAEIALRHYQMPDLAAFIASLRPLRFDRMGGDMTIMYGPKR